MESLWFNWSIKQAIDYPRLHHQLFPTYIMLDPNFPKVNLFETDHNEKHDKN